MPNEYTVTWMKPPEGKRRLIQEVGNFCFRCRMKPADDRRIVLHVDHIIPVARGGQDVYENFQLLCGPCNSWKGTRIFDFRPGKRHHEIIVENLPIIPNAQRVRKYRPLSLSVVSRPPARPLETPAIITAQIQQIHQFETRLSYADETMTGLRDQVDDLRAQRDAERQRADDLAETLIALRASLSAAQAERDRLAGELARGGPGASGDGSGGRGGMDVVERERILVEAAERYIRGEISLEEHTRIRREHRFNYVAAVKALEREQRRSWLKPWTW